MTNPPRIEWQVQPNAPADYLLQLAEIPALAAQVLWARGLTDPQAARDFWIETPDTANPFALRDMDMAVERILRAIASGETIALYGDYDCDGVTANALLTHTFRKLGKQIIPYIPDRFEEGYGLNSAALDKLRDKGAAVVISVDCGARAHAEALHARAIGIDLIVTDHHELEGDELPVAYALINLRRPDCAYPFKSLAGVGVAYRLAQALLSTAGHPAESARELLDLVAIGTVADIVPLVGENRALVREGLRRINAEPRAGVRKLVLASRAKPGEVTAQTIGFALGPRLNAAGRIDSALDAYHLLVTDDEQTAADIAGRLNERNEQRQRLTAEITQHAEQAAFADVGADAPLLFAASYDYNAGVIGLAATRLVEHHYRPAVVVALHKQEARGSCRSVEGFHITAALDECRDLLTRHGGHAAAAGFTLPANQLNDLRARLLEVALRLRPADGWTRVLRADAEVNLHKHTMETYAGLQRLEPHGMSNPRPLFVARSALVQSAQRMGKTNGSADTAAPHLKLRVRDVRGATWEAIGWRMGERIAECGAGAKIDIAFQFDVNEWNNERKLQLILQDFRSADALIIA